MRYKSDDAGISNPACGFAAVWRNAKDICALADNERHLGHVVRNGQWQAFDATRLDAAESGFLHVGSFLTVNAAKEAVDRSVGGRAGELVLGAGR